MAHGGALPTGRSTACVLLQPFHPRPGRPRFYARFRNWRLYGEEGLPKKEATLWLEAESLTLEYRGLPLSRYEVRFAAESEGLQAIMRPRLFETSYAHPQLRLFGLDDLGNEGWLKVLKLDGYAPRNPRRPQALQHALFPYVAAL